MRWTCTICLALLLAPALASAQADGEQAPPEATSPEATTPDDGASEGTADGADDAVPAQDSDGPREATQDDPMPARGTSSVEVNEQEQRLRREQEAMLDETAEGTQQATENADESLDHEFQLGIRGGVGVPFLFALRYNNGPPCDDTGEQFCLNVGSALVTFDLSFGLSTDIEVVVGGRIGAVGVEPTNSSNIQLLLGLRAYISPESIAKVYLSPNLVLDLTEAGALAGMNWGDVDFGVRGAFGVQIDMVRFVGLYVELGVNILFLRSFGIAPDLQGGFQVRFP